MWTTQDDTLDGMDAVNLESIIGQMWADVEADWADYFGSAV